MYAIFLHSIIFYIHVIYNYNTIMSVEKLTVICHQIIITMNKYIRQ